MNNELGKRYAKALCEAPAEIEKRRQLEALTENVALMEAWAAWEINEDCILDVETQQMMIDFATMVLNKRKE